ncbi:MAG: hypothetical protein M1818_002291 [Claussenomyces sp. TS43310]|nr:MAG: hypothetical protein M1818_002291 [Claussenomyces sp. TS43310]
MAATATQHLTTSEHFSLPTISPAQQPASTVGTSSLTAPATTQKEEYVPRDVATTVNYHKDNEDGSPPAPSYAGRAETFERPVVAHAVNIHDIRGTEDKYGLDTTGFQIMRHKSVETSFVDDEEIKRRYYPEIESILKEATGANRVLIFDHTIRRSPADQRSSATPSEKPSEKAAAALRGPVQRVHIDQSYSAGRSRVAHHLPDEAEELLRGRHQIINVWRPIRTILKNPLTIAEANSVSDDDLVPTKLIYPDREGETYAVRAGNGHRWFYLNEQTPEEVLLIKCFDSKTDGRARRVPHTAFVDPERENEAARESIEVRALVFGE